MLQVEELYSLKRLNTFGLDVVADYFINLKSTNEIIEFLENKNFNSVQQLVIGNGSNILFVDSFRGVVVKPNIQGIDIINEDSDYAEVRCGAGVDWDTFVEWTVDRGLGGLENLSYIPGTVGASPVQNIGAYGAEVKDTIIAVEGIRLSNNDFFVVNNFDCEFGYRTSIFKKHVWARGIIAYVIFRLNKKPEFNASYGSVLAETKKLGEINLRNIRQAIINIRSNKLPDPSLIGNAGSFFKNPLVNINNASRLKKLYPDIPVFKANDGQCKLSAAYLIEKCGWKGHREGDAGVHAEQPLILVNYGKATGMELYQLARKIDESVRKTFGIELEMEVNIIF